MPGGLKKAPISEQLCLVEEIAKKIVDRLTIVLSAYLDITENSNDNIFNYTRNLCHYGSLMIEFRDAWAEGDGERVERCQRLMLPHFRASGRTKYALEALRFQTSCFHQIWLIK